ncbi:MAG TPA: hypothetical protein VEW42_02855 [Candidatus Eisenbacteria bacterium]|nr:hypothetical protein [Candidatus Eisenbacteria bacterium]
MYLVFFTLLLGILFFLSRRLTMLISRILMRFFHSHHIVIYALSFLFLPGVVVHEFSHLLIANILLVPTGEVEFFPEIQGNQVKMGSVAIAKTDPLRRFLIGVAPVIGGLGILLLSFAYLHTPTLSWQSALLLYIVFQVGNTMFSSSKDMEGAVGFVIGTMLVGIVVQILGVPLVAWLVAVFQNPLLTSILGNINIYLFLAVGLDIFFVLLLAGLVRLKK